MGMLFCGFAGLIVQKRAHEYRFVGKNGCDIRFCVCVEIVCVCVFCHIMLEGFYNILDKGLIEMTECVLSTFKDFFI